MKTLCTSLFAIAIFAVAAIPNARADDEVVYVSSEATTTTTEPVTTAVVYVSSNDCDCEPEPVRFSNSECCDIDEGTLPPEWGVVPW